MYRLVGTGVGADLYVQDLVYRLVRTDQICMYRPVGTDLCVQTRVYLLVHSGTSATANPNSKAFQKRQLLLFKLCQKSPVLANLWGGALLRRLYTFAFDYE